VDGETINDDGGVDLKFRRGIFLNGSFWPVGRGTSGYLSHR